MIIYDHKNKQQLTEITLFLTPAEASELAASSADLAKHQEHHHHHISNAAFTREVILAVYTKETVGKFDVESQKLLQENG